jgi:hypothetical protein
LQSPNLRIARPNLFVPGGGSSSALGCSSSKLLLRIILAFPGSLQLVFQPPNLILQIIVRL